MVGGTGGRARSTPCGAISPNLLRTFMMKQSGGQGGPKVGRPVYKNIPTHAVVNHGKMWARTLEGRNTLLDGIEGGSLNVWRPTHNRYGCSATSGTPSFFSFYTACHKTCAWKPILRCKVRCLVFIGQVTEATVRNHASTHEGATLLLKFEQKTKKLLFQVWIIYFFFFFLTRPIGYPYLP